MKNHSMKTTIRNLALTTVTLLAAGIGAGAQEILPREEALRYALLAALNEPSQTQAPFQVDIDIKRPVAGYDGDYGAMVLPETKLTAKTFEQVGTSVVPVGQLWLKKLTPMEGGSAIEVSRLQMVSIWVDGENHSVPVCHLGVTKLASGALELGIYGKGKEPMLRVPMKPIQKTQALPIELSAEREYDSGKVTLRFAGRYEATFSLTELPD